MRLVRAFVYGSMALMLAAGWGFLYWQSGTIDLAAGNAARAALADLRAIDARWDDQVTAMGLAMRPSAPPAPVAHQAALAARAAPGARPSTKKRRWWRASRRAKRSPKPPGACRRARASTRSAA